MNTVASVCVFGFEILFVMGLFLLFLATLLFLRLGAALLAANGLFGGAFNA